MYILCGAQSVPENHRQRALSVHHGPPFPAEISGEETHLREPPLLFFPKKLACQNKEKDPLPKPTKKNSRKTVAKAELSQNLLGAAGECGQAVRLIRGISRNLLLLPAPV